MKANKVYILTLAALGIWSMSCSDLDLNPHDQLSESTFWQSASDAELAIAGMYDQLKAGEPWGANSFINSFSLPAMDALTDNAYTQHNRLGLKNAMVVPFNSQTGGIVTDFYSIAYKQIATSNYFLENVDRIEADASVANKWKAEARFFRALMYHYLCEFYGGVPISTASYTLEDELLGRAPVDDVVGQVLEDLDFAIANLDNDPFQGRVVKGAAQALKVRALMARERWAEAAAVANDIIGDSPFDLSPSFTSLFTAPEQPGNPEIIFSVRYLKPNAEHIGSLNWGWWLSVTPLANFVDEFEMKNGLPITDPGSGFDPNNPYVDRDPRMSETVDHEGSVFGFPGNYGGVPYVWDDTNRGLPAPLMYNLRKYADRTFQESVDASNHCDTDYVILRFGEVLLNYAEAQNEAAGPDGTVYDAINRIRIRAGMPEIPAGLSQDAMRDVIRHERRVELAFEGIHWFDLKRWGTLVDAVNSVDDTQVPVAYTHNDNNMLWPIPQAEIDFYSANGLDLGQNPGY